MAPDAANSPAADDPFLSLRHGGTELYLIRHADALPDSAEVVAGDYDAQALSALGRRQADALAAALADRGLGAVYSSPTGRAWQTAQAVAAPYGHAVQAVADLREVELGEIGVAALEQTPEARAAALRQRLQEIAYVALGHGQWASIPGSEPAERLRARVVAAVDDIAGVHPGQRVAIVSHGGSINAYVAAILGIARDYFFPAANTSISVVRVRGTRHLVMALNDIGHLRAAGLVAEATRLPNGHE